MRSRRYIHGTKTGIFPDGGMEGVSGFGAPGQGNKTLQNGTGLPDCEGILIVIGKNRVVRGKLLIKDQDGDMDGSL